MFHSSSLPRQLLQCQRRHFSKCYRVSSMMRRQQGALLSAPMMATNTKFQSNISRFYSTSEEQKSKQEKENTVDDEDIKKASEFRKRKQGDPRANYPTAAVLLTGCGAFDGSDTMETVALTIQMWNYGIRPVFYAPTDAEIGMVYDHSMKSQMPNEERWAFKESARLARGDLHPLSELNADDHLALFIPGGDGAIRTLSDIFLSHEHLDWTLINEDAENAVKGFHQAKKPIVSFGNAGIFVAQVLGKGRNGPGVTVTTAKDHVQWVTDSGSVHEMADDIVLDRENLILSLAGSTDVELATFDIYQMMEQCGDVLETLSTELLTDNANIKRDQYLEAKGGPLTPPDKQSGA